MTSTGRSIGAARLVRALLERNTQLPPEFIEEQENRREEDLGHELYDVTAWSVGLMSGVAVDVCGSIPGGTALTADAPIPAVTGGSGEFGIAVPRTDSGHARLVTQANRDGHGGRCLEELEFHVEACFFEIVALIGDEAAGM